MHASTPRAPQGVCGPWQFLSNGIDTRWWMLEVIPIEQRQMTDGAGLIHVVPDANGNCHLHIGVSSKRCE